LESTIRLKGMSANLGRLVKSRSNGRLLVAIEDYISAYSEAVLIASSSLAGEGIAHRGKGFAGLHRTTLVRCAAELARPEMARRGLAPLSSLGVEALAARVIHAERDAGPFVYFEDVAAMPGFARALARTLADLRLAGVAPASLKRTGAPGEDLARLLTRYVAELEERSLADAARVFELAAQARSHHRWLGLPLVFLDAPLDSYAHREFFRFLAGQAPAVFAAVTEGAEELEKILGVKAEDLDGGAPETSLEHLRQYLFSASPPRYGTEDERFEVFSAPGEALEAVEITRRILRIAEGGVPFDRMAILLRSPDRYQPMVEDALRRAAIPAYFSRGTARPDAGGRAFLALLACAAEKCPASRFAEYLSLGQVPAGQVPAAEWVGAEDELLASGAPDGTVSDRAEKPAPSAWEKLLVDAAVIGGRERWARRLHGLEREFELRLAGLEREDDQTSRKYLTRQLEQLRQFEEFALPLIETLDGLPGEALWKDWLEAMDALARRALRNPEAVLSVLAEFEPMGDVGPATLEEVAEVLGERLGFLRRDAPDRRYGRVLVCSIEESRGQEFEVVFLPGLAEGLFPQKALEDPLLLDAFRTAADENLLLRHDRVDQERVRLRLAVAAAGGKLVASYPRMDVAEARPRVPSFYALELPRAIQGRLPELKKFEEQARDAAPARLNWPAPNEVADAIDDTEYDLCVVNRPAPGCAHYLVDANDHLVRSLRTRWLRWESKTWREQDGLITTHAGTLAALAEHRLTARAWSPSALQKFSACPYQFALHGIFGLRPRETPEALEQMDPLTRGALFHAVQFQFLGALKAAELLPVNGTRLAEALEIADRVLNRVAGEFADKLAPAIDRVWKTEIEDLRTDLRGWLQHIAVNDEDWIPEHFEFAFGLRRSGTERDPASTAEEAVLDEGVRLRGSIDLVERHRTRGVLRVTDHKTGKPPETPPAYVGGGSFLQPLLYGLAARRLLNSEVESGRLLYATQRGEYKHAEIQITERSRAFLGKLLLNIDGCIEKGFLPPAPQKDACGYCDYRPVCGPYEELRSGRKNRRDERLEALTEVRGMA
jgi:ATP-dependent helicase/nuclease subunit B